MDNATSMDPGTVSIVHAPSGKAVQYELSEGARLKGSVQKVGAAINALKVRTPETVLDAARSKRSPLHREFEWNDSRAAKAHRLEQASYLLRVIHVRITVAEREPIRTRAFVQIKQREPYRPVVEVLNEQESRERLLANAHRELMSFRQKYAALSELSSVFAAIDDLLP